MGKFSVIIPIYFQNDAQQFAEALESIWGQTRKPDEIVIVADGPISVELTQVVEGMQARIDENNLHVGLVFITLTEHAGLGEAMRIGVERASYEYVARMDADDISLPERFEKQLACFETDKELSIVGGQIADFDGDLQHVTGRRIVPRKHADILRFMKSRNGMNHVTVMARKIDLLKAGNYQSLSWFEDYHLWIRMLLIGCKFMNVPDTLVMVRAGKAQVDRRGGWNYFKHEVRLFRYMRHVRFISEWRFLVNCAERCGVRLLMPLWMREWFYKRFLREQ